MGSEKILPMARIKAETPQPQLFSLAPGLQHKPFHSDVAPPEELPPGDTEQGSLFGVLTPSRRGRAAKQSEPINPDDLTQSGMFGQVEQGEVRTIAECFVEKKPIIEETQKTVHGKTIKRTEWKCTFTSPPDLWHLDNPAIIHVSAIDPETIKLAKAAKLQRGNYVTITGRVTNEHEQPMGNDAEPRQITYLTLINILSVVRPSTAKTKTNIAPLLARRG